MGGGEMVGVVCATGLMAVDAVSRTNGRVTIGSGD